jgi:hypothetical protein
MAQVIIYTNDNGGVSMTIPTGELSIEEVQAKDTPAGSIIVDVADLPDGDFDAWELIDGKVVVNLDKKNAIELQKESAQLAKTSALAKLSAIGLTEDEIKALVG